MAKTKTDPETTPAPVAPPAAFSIPQIDIRDMEVTIIGDSPLICHAWSPKAIKGMLKKQMKEAKAGKDAKDPQVDYEESLYPLPDGSGYGFPCLAFKSAAVGACRFSDGIKMTEARGAFHVVGELATIEGTPRPRQDMVRIGMGTADVRFRGEFPTWRTRLRVQFNAAALSPAQIVNLFNIAGFGVGVGEWRPEKDGSYGRFHVARDGE